ncbi:MAG: hypothetical protein IPI11_09170 [Haliscomenobacter sp.]|nr:hypothetical protein [Haliscomenobacter sp.]
MSLYRTIQSAWILLFLFAAGCQPAEKKNPVSPEGETLVSESASLACAQKALAVKMNALWDSVAVALGQNLPKDMPADERKNMLAVRNTSLIQMFEVYPTLDAGIHKLVEQAGEEDVAIALQLKEIQNRIQDHEARVAGFLAGIKDQKEAADWTRKLTDAKDAACE